MEDLNLKGAYLKKMLKIFEESTKDLINKFNNFKEGLNKDEIE